MTDRENRGNRKDPAEKLSRRQFLEKAGKLGGAVFLSSLAGKALAGEWEQGMEEYWTEGSFTQDTVDASMEAQGIIKAFLDGRWEEFQTVTLPGEFMDWNLAARLDVLDSIAMMFSGEGGSPPSLAGPHNAAMATWGGRRADSLLTINNAFKGMGLCPRRDLIKDRMTEMEELSAGGMGDRLRFLRDLYSTSDNFDLTKMISLELYSTPEFETHTFINLMERPTTSLVFLDSKSYEVRGIGQLVAPEDPRAGEYARDIVRYTNMAHSFFHGDFPRLYPGILVHITSVFDNSPGTGRGVRIAPPLV
ncbi:MAG: hypothetical protein JXA64_08980 [Candidatus Fermentibacteraceae bacterium]|nr:hypothetical protein [Candidatus Fermentibacteraceae bacterium]MBN2609236.1 hypothetical protein [Candidatus Fermentibacteraceae bacterium]